mgnify:CR=1 FL=1
MNQTEAEGNRPTGLSPQAEQDLIRRSQSGDLEAFDRIVIAYQSQVYGLAYRLMGNYDDANDLAQEVFIACFRKIGQFRGDSRLQTWLYRIVVNMAKNAWKRRERRGYSKTISIDEINADDDAPTYELPSDSPDPRRQVEAFEASNALQGCLDKLNTEQREALVLRCVQDLSYEEIADILNCNLGTVKSRINRARSELRKLMKDFL